jgi:F0F1-type ATP synthase membrane subunit a
MAKSKKNDAVIKKSKEKDKVIDTKGAKKTKDPIRTKGKALKEVVKTNGNKDRVVEYDPSNKYLVMFLVIIIATILGIILFSLNTTSSDEIENNVQNTVEVIENIESDMTNGN